MSTFTKSQLAEILSAMDDRPRRPANRAAGLKSIERSAEQYGLTVDKILGVARGLLDGRLSPADFRAELHELAEQPEPAQTSQETAMERHEPAPADDEPGPSAELAPAGRAPSNAEPETATAKAAKAKPEAAEKPAPRAGTKQALMIDMLRRPEGATVEQIAEATGWQHHTIRGAISGTLKKKLGLNVTSETVAGRGRVYRIV